MHIVIFGANRLSAHIASILSEESHGIYLIDSEPSKLDKVSSELDVSTMLDSKNSWEILDQLKEVKPDALLALTDNEEKNLTLCKIAKQLNYPLTVALLQNESYTHASKINFNEIFSVDHFICPSLLTAQEIFKYIAIPRSSGAEHFAHGAIHIHKMRIPPSWNNNTSLDSLPVPEGLKVALIRRKSSPNDSYADANLIFPHGSDVLLADDEVTFIGMPHAIDQLFDYFKVSFQPIQSVVLIGGSLIAINIARLLIKKGLRITIIEKDLKTCESLASMFPTATVLNEDGCNMRFMQMGQIGKNDAIIGCSSHDEVNILACSIGKNLGCKLSIATISESGLGNTLEQVHVDYCASPHEAMTNRILSILQRQKVVAVTSLYENRAKILELKISKDSPLVGIPIVELKNYLPKDFLIAAIQNRGRIIIADNTKVLCSGDTVIVVTHPKHYNDLQRLF